mgnify:FL=1|jgi:hypothetical protein
MDLYYKFNTFSAMFLFNNNYIDSYIELTLNIIISLQFTTLLMQSYHNFCIYKIKELLL